MTMTASLSLPQTGIGSAELAEVQMILAVGRLPDAPLAMPTQVLERKRPAFALSRALFDRPLRPAGA